MKKTTMGISIIAIVLLISSVSAVIIDNEYTEKITTGDIPKEQYLQEKFGSVDKKAQDKELSYEKVQPQKSATVYELKVPESIGNNPKPTQETFTYPKNDTMNNINEFDQNKVYQEITTGDIPKEQYLQEKFGSVDKKAQDKELSYEKVQPQKSATVYELKVPENIR
ncbi:MAG: hypothetical protein KO202_04155 [Methanobacteriaceae archaeon]|jgi:hypothetical protein|nr:hypothetical protein [Methanobacteriaceae archaeon]